MKIRLELARNAEFPEGSRAHGYEFIAPLGEDGHLDRDAGKTSAKLAGSIASGMARMTNTAGQVRYRVDERRPRAV